MAAQKEFPMDFPKCPHCGSEDTIGKVAFAKEGMEGLVPQLGVKMSPLLKQGGIAALTIPCVMSFEDTCANCGTSRTVKAQMQPMPADQVMAMMGAPVKKVKL